MVSAIRTALLALAGLAATLSLGLADPVAAQGEVENPSDPYVHKVVGIAFPEELNGFERGKVFEFDADGSDAAVAYGVSDLPGEITVYVYPHGGLTCAEQFARSDSAVTERGGEALNSEAVFSIPAFEDATQLSRSYRIEAGGYGYDHPELISFLWVGCPAGGNYIVKYRASFFASDAMKIFGIEQKLLGAIDWSPLLER